MKKILLLICAIFLSSCSSVTQPKRSYIYIDHGTDDAFETIELSEIRKYSIQSNAKITTAGKSYKNNVLDCEDYVRITISEIMLNHSYELTPLVYQVNIEMNGEIHAVMGFVNAQQVEVLYDPQSYSVISNAKVIKKVY